MLNSFASVASELGCVPTFAITAVILKRHPEVIREMSRAGIEFAIHGHIHTDYGVLPLDEQVNHFGRAIEVFKDCGIPFTGFRAPFLRTNDYTYRALGQLGFAYDSSRAVHWDVLGHYRNRREGWGDYQRLLDFYQAKKAEDCPVLPWFRDGFWEIPVSIPDDEAMVERLGITDAGEIGAIWSEVLQKTHDRGELFTLQLHPERISLCKGALANTVRRARQLSPAVWVATLREITQWWQERKGFVFKINTLSPGKYEINAVCSGRATVLVKGCKVDVPTAGFFGSCQNVDSRNFIVESKTSPVIGISPDCSRYAIDFLRDEGYAVEGSNQPGEYGVYLSGLAQFGDADKRALLEKLENSDAPLIRFWRWPNQAKSALSITGDIDSLTLGDFALRVFENWLEGRHAIVEQPAAHSS
jgi:hypothetical protein